MAETKMCRECLKVYPNTLEYFPEYYSGTHNAKAVTSCNCHPCEARVIKQGRALLRQMQMRRAKRQLKKSTPKVEA